MFALLLKSLLVPVSAHEHDTKLLAGSSDVLVKLNELRREGATRWAPMCADVNADHVHSSQVFERVCSSTSMRGLRSCVKIYSSSGDSRGASAAEAHNFCAVKESKAGLRQLRLELLTSLHFTKEVSE